MITTSNSVGQFDLWRVFIKKWDQSVHFFRSIWVSPVYCMNGYDWQGRDQADICISLVGSPVHGFRVK